MSWGLVILMAVFVEGFLTYIRSFFADGKFQWPMLATLALGLFICFLYRIEIPMILGAPEAGYLGMAISGVIISRGSNYVFDVLSAIGKAGKK